MTNQVPESKTLKTSDESQNDHPKTWLELLEEESSQRPPDEWRINGDDEPKPLLSPVTYYSVAESEKTTETSLQEVREATVSIAEAIFQLRREVHALREEMATGLTNFDLKKAKKNRTLVNRCTYVNRRNEMCRGYICKVKGSQLCYAHHVLATASQYPERRKKLY